MQEKIQIDKSQNRKQLYQQYLATKQQQQPNIFQQQNIGINNSNTEVENNVPQTTQQEETIEMLPKVSFSKKFENTIKSIPDKVFYGITKFGEGVVDFGANVGNKLGLISDEKTAEFTARDLSTELMNNKYYNAWLKHSIGDNTYLLRNALGKEENYTDQVNNSFFTGNKVGEIAGSVLEGAGRMLPSIALNVVTGGTAGTVLSTASFGVGAIGSSTESALNEGATLDEAQTYGLLSGLAETAIELVSGGIGGVGKGLIDSVFKGATSKLATKPAIKFIVSALGEGVEEVASELLDPVFKRLTYDENAPSATLEQITESFVVGALTSAVLQGGSTVMTPKGIRVAEQIEAELDLQEKALKTKDYNAIERSKQRVDNLSIQFAEEMQKVGITAEDLALQRIDKNISKTKEDLEVEKDSSYTERLNILEAQKEETISKMPKEAREQYLQRTNQYYKYDVETGKQSELWNALTEEHKAQVESTVEFLNNSNLQTNKLINLEIDYVQQKTDTNTNGYFIQEDGNTRIVINPEKMEIEGVKQNIIAHEYMHVVENTESGKKLKNIAIDFFKEQGTYESKFKEYKEKYESIAKKELSQEYIEQEITADFVKDNLFKDQKSINRIASQERNVAKKIYNWIKTKLSSLQKSNTEKQLQNTLRKAENMYIRALNESRKQQESTNTKKYSLETKEENTKRSAQETALKNVEGKLVFDRTKIKNQKFADLMEKAVNDKNSEINFRKFEEGKDFKGSKRGEINLLRSWTEQDLQTVAELGERTQQPQSKSNQDLLVRFLKDFGATKQIKIGQYNFEVVRDEFMPTYLQRILDANQEFNSPIYFFVNDNYNFSGVKFNNATNERAVLVQSGIDLYSISNHETFHFLKSKEDLFLKQRSFMREIYDELLKNGDLEQAIDSVKYSGYRSLRKFPDWNETFETSRNSCLEELCCEMVGGNYQTDSAKIKDIVDNFVKENSNFMLKDVVEDNVERDLKHVFNPFEIANVKAYDSFPTLDKVLGNVEIKQEPRGKSFLDVFKRGLVDAQAGITEFYKKVGKDFDKGMIEANYARGHAQRANFALENGIYFKSGEKLSKSMQEIFIDTLPEGIVVDSKEHIQYKRELFDYLLHQHNIDRMNITEDLTINHFTSLAQNGLINKESIDSISKAFNSDSTIKSLSLKDLRKIIEDDIEYTIIKRELTTHKEIFGKYLKLDVLSKEAMEVIEKKIPSLKEELEIRDLSEDELKNKLDINNLTSGDKKILMDSLIHVSPRDSQKIIANYEAKYPKFKQIAKDVWELGDAILKIKLESGLITQEQYRFFRERYPRYVPTFRETKVIGGLSLGTVSASATNGIQTAKGSDTVIQPIDIMLSNIINKTYKNIAINDLLNDMYKTYTENKDTSKMYMHELEEVKSRKSVSADEDLEIGKVEDMQGAQTVSFYKKGEKYTVVVNENIALGISHINSTKGILHAKVKKPLQAINRTFKSLITNWNPLFSFRNFARDIQDSIVYTKNGVSNFGKNLTVAVKEIATNGEYWLEYRQHGGLYSGYVGAQYGFEANMPKGNKAKRGLRKVGKAIERVNMSIEQIPRMAEYISSRKAGKSIQESLNDAAEITVNFGRSGSAVRELNATGSPFLNPTVQGVNKIYRFFTSPKSARQWGALLFKVGCIGMLPALFNAIAYDDDEEYQALGSYYKDNFYLIKFGDTFLKIPKGRLLGAVSSFFDRSMNAYKTKDAKESFEGYKDVLGKLLDPTNNFRTIASPIQDVITNTTWYGGKIEPEYMQNIRPKNRYDKDTSKFAIKIGQSLNASPKKVEYLIDQYFGIAGDVLLGDRNNTGAFKDIPASILQKEFIVDSTFKNKYSSNFFDYFTEVQYDKNDGIANAQILYKYMNSVKKTISELRKEQDALEAQNKANLNSLEYKTLQIGINNAYRNGLDNAKQIDIFLKTNYFELSEQTLEDDYFEIIRLNLGAKEALRQYNTKVFEKADLLYNYANIEYDTFYCAYFNLRDLQPDYDQDGLTIKGSKKKKALKIINSLDKVSKSQKLLIMLKLGYTIDLESKEYLKKVLKSKGLSKTQIDALLS